MIPSGFGTFGALHSFKLYLVFSKYCCLGLPSSVFFAIFTLHVSNSSFVCSSNNVSKNAFGKKKKISISIQIVRADRWTVQLCLSSVNFPLLFFF